jgi:hypothetical protein
MLYIVLLIFLPLVIAGLKKLFRKPEVTDAYMFDDYVCNDFFIVEKYEALPIKTSTEELLPDDSPEPDFKFRQLETNLEFFIVTKFVPDSNNIMVEWCAKNRFEFLRKFTKPNLFILIGMGGTSYLPDELYLVPFKQMINNKISRDLLRQYSILNKDNIIDFLRY